MRQLFGSWCSRLAAPMSLLMIVLTMSGCTPTTPPDDNDNTPRPLPGVELLDVQKTGQGEVAETGDGSSVTVTATPADGWRFDGWSGASTSTDNPLTLTVTEEAQLTARFVEIGGSDSDGDGVADEDDDCANTPSGTLVGPDGCPADADGDGVSDLADNCPNTPAGTQVNSNGCPVVPTDADGDGVANAADQCAGTPTGATVDANGCSETQRDADDDGVSDDRDQCADTPAQSEVDSNGCPTEEVDADNDGVPNEDDDCPGTAANSTVNDNGCSAAQRDSDGDGVKDDLDTCPNTAAGRQVDANGCIVTQPGGGGGNPTPTDADGDGVTDDRDTCPNTPAGQTVDVNGCPTDVCGRGSSACFNTATTPGCNDAVCCQAVCAADDFCCRADGQWDSSCVTKAFDLCANAPDAPANNECANPITVTDGSTDYNNINGTTDGPLEGGLCAGIRVGSDVWFSYTATCSGVLIASLCGSNYDTTMAVYLGTGCPQAGALGCSDDDCGFGLESRATVAVTVGQQYTIRVGGFVNPQTTQASTGTGTLTLICGPDASNSQACGGQGECFEGHDTPGCSDGDCCSTVCDTDPYCCDVEWDDFCAQEAGGLCTGSFASCGAEGTSACNQESDVPGCAGATCCNDICTEDPYCCLQKWDSECVTKAANRAGCP